jgi:hypothetical protein
MLKHRQRGNRRAQSASQAGRRLAALCSAAMCIFAPVPSASAATPTTFGPSANRACLVTAAHPDAELQMPTPKRLPKVLVVNLGTDGPDTLLPPLPSQHSAITTAQLRSLWKSASPKERGAIYQLVLARFTSRLPASAGPHGQVVPTNNDRLSWVLVARRCGSQSVLIAGPPGPGGKTPGNPSSSVHLCRSQRVFVGRDNRAGAAGSVSFASLKGPPLCQKHGTTSRPLRPAVTMISAVA